MPSHQDRREPLPQGYQFGDAHRWAHALELFHHAKPAAAVPSSLLELEREACDAIRRLSRQRSA